VGELGAALDSGSKPTVHSQQPPATERKEFRRLKLPVLRPVVSVRVGFPHNSRTVVIREEVHDLAHDIFQGAPVKTRRLDFQQAVREVLRLFRQRRPLSHRDIAEALRVDIGTARGACAELERRGLIKSDPSE
jgi:IclR-like helix-turn-helix domain-containing protein